MRGRSRAGSAKSRRRKPATPKRASGTEAARPRSSSAAGQESEAARLASELSAMSKILRLIAKSPSNLTTVLQSVAQQAAQICQAQYVDIFVIENDKVRNLAWFGEINRTLAFPLDRSSAPGRSVCDMRPVSVDDMQNVGDEFFQGREVARKYGHRSIAAVPLIREGQVLGTIVVSRTEVRPFERKHIDLLTNFAAQAVIAIENARLLNELRQRTADLSESLEQQTATSDVLNIISSSPGDLQPVFSAMLESAARLCDALFGNIFRWDDDALRLVATYNTPEDLRKFIERNPIPRDRHSAAGRAALERRAIHIPDVQADAEFTYGAIAFGSVRTVLAVPIIKGDDLLGVLVVNGLEGISPFTDKQIALVKTFADQAAIAIDNVRLLDELRQRTEEVGKLNQQLEQRVADQVGEIERMSRLRRFLPPQVADLIVASGSEKQLESHRREITALFCDLRGFTGFSESSDPEDVMALLREYHAAIGEIIVKYSGTLERFAGDGVMVIFNDPVPVENPALQAVLMALDMRVAIGGLIEKWRELGHDLGFGIGIAHGFATLEQSDSRVGETTPPSARYRTSPRGFAMRRSPVKSSSVREFGKLLRRP